MFLLAIIEGDAENVFFRFEDMLVSVY